MKNVSLYSIHVLIGPVVWLLASADPGCLVGRNKSVVALRYHIVFVFRAFISLIPRFNPFDIPKLAVLTLQPIWIRG